MQVANAIYEARETTSTEKEEEFFLTMQLEIGDNNCAVSAQKKGVQGLEQRTHAKLDPCKSRLKKFNALVDQYREYQPKPGRETKISELRQVQVGPKASEIEMCCDCVEEPKSVWNPFILPEAESNQSPA